MNGENMKSIVRELRDIKQWEERENEKKLREEVQKPADQNTKNEAKIATLKRANEELKSRPEKENKKSKGVMRDKCMI